MAQGDESGRNWRGTGLVVLVAGVLLAAGAVGYRVMSGPVVEASELAPSGREALEARVAKNPRDVAAWQQLGFLHFDEGRFFEAEKAYVEAVELDPENAVLWSSLGEARVMASTRDPMPTGAVAAFERAVGLDANDPRARYFLAVRKDLAGDHEGAIGDWLALYEDTPPGAPWENDLKRTIEQVGAINAIPVEVRLATVEAKRPQSAGAMAGIPGPTREEITAAASIPPSEQRAMAESMVARLEARLASDPTDVDGWIMLMRSRRTLGDGVRAQRALRDAISANPGARAKLQEAARQLGIGAG